MRAQTFAADVKAKITGPTVFDPVKAARKIGAPTGAPAIKDQIDIMAQRTIKYLSAVRPLTPADYPAAVLRLKDQLFADHGYFLKYIGRLADRLVDAGLTDPFEFITGIFRQCKYEGYPAVAQTNILREVLAGVMLTTAEDKMTPDILGAKTAPLVRALRGENEFPQIKLLLLVANQLYAADKGTEDYRVQLGSQLIFLKEAARVLSLNEELLTSPVRNKLAAS